MPTKDLDCKHEYYRYICTGAENLNYKSFPSIWLNINGDNDTRYLGIQPQDYVNLVGLYIYIYILYFIWPEYYHPSCNIQLRY